MVQWLLASLVNLLINILESSFKKQQQQVHNENSNDDANFFHDNASTPPGGGNMNKKDDEKLRRAYEFMELTPPCESLEQVRKQYKKLSLRHHPDRNGGSSESQELMQTLNACFAMIEKDIQGDDEDADDGMEDDKDDVPKSREEAMAEMRQKMKEMETMRQKMRDDMKREMEEEMKKYRQEKQAFNEKKQKEKGQCHRKQSQMGLNTEEGRRDAHKTFRMELETLHKAKQEKKTTPPASKGKINNTDSMHDIDDENIEDSASSERNEPDTKDHQVKEEEKEEEEEVLPKPKNYVMECNVDDIVVAMRLGFPDVALEVMQEDINKFIQQKGSDALFSGRPNISMATVGIEFLTLPLDFDDNTLLHYAAYYECYQVLRTVCGTALKFDGLEIVLEKPNKYGQSALTFAEIAQDESILPLLQTHISMVEAKKVKTKFIPAIQAALVRSWGIVRHMDLAATFSTLLAFFVGYKVFNLHAFTSLVGVIYMQHFSDSEDLSASHSMRGITEVTILFSFFGTWKFTRFLIGVLYPFIMWELLLILAPFGIAAFVSSRRGGALAGLIEFALLPLKLQAYAARYLGQLLAAVDFTPQVIHKKQLAQPFLLILMASLSLAIRLLFQ
jgi:hypothetical protein